MLIGYVSDEMDIAIADAQLELIGSDGASVEARSRASGAVHASIEPGRYRAVLTAPAHGRKWLDLDIGPDHQPIRFRLQSDRLLGYAWPKWARAGDRVELRVHSPESYQASLWR
jgi:hypothetical protein